MASEDNMSKNTKELAVHSSISTEYKALTSEPNPFTQFYGQLLHQGTFSRRFRSLPLYLQSLLTINYSRQHVSGLCAHRDIPTRHVQQC